MRRLILLRHAKAEPVQPGQSDRDRVLEARGRDDARTMGAYLARHGFAPAAALVSSAARTRETYTLAASALGHVPVTYEDNLYDATPEDIRAVITDSGDTAPTLLVVGHNPGLHALALELVGSGEVEARQRLQEKFPTSGVAVIDFVAEDWSHLRPHAGRLERFVSPRSLSAAVD